MEALFIFIIKSSALLVLFYCAYYFLLDKETFFNSNRWFLLAGLFTSLILPFVVFTKIVWIDPAPVSILNTNAISVLNKSQISFYRSAQIESFDINWSYILLAIYSIGFLTLLVKFAIDFYSLNSVLKDKKVQQQADFKFVDIKENIAPFSYFDYIVYNSSMFTASELENIIEHEKVHSDQNHTVDVLVSRIFCILFWFNPIIWMYKKAILQNLEFIADNEAAKKISDKKAYQYTLLKITTHESCVAITNHFYQSLIKKRIVMLNKNQSKKRNCWKYYTIIPVLIAFVLLFQIRTIAQEKERKDLKENTQNETPVYVLKIRKNTTDQELKEMAEKLKKDHNIDMVVSNVKRNTQNELTAIKVDINKETENAQSIEVEGDEAIKNCGIIVTTKDGLKNINLLTDGLIDEPATIRKRIAEISQTNGSNLLPASPVSPTPPALPAFPTEPIPQAPNADISKMPNPPIAPADRKDKVAMAKFEIEMAEFEKKMETFQPDMSAYEKQVEEIMSQREAAYEKEMAKYNLAMDKFSSDMDKLNIEMEQKYGKDSKIYETSMKQRNLEMRRLEINKRQHEKDVLLYERELQKIERQNNRF
ncbi:M56 family metallopeptidase [Flavobacterium sp. NPDC079362]|uniref:M56 family metallopeptidase n=1 Tax=Flavobacterium sp. NPDC079362 TaxID=3390566 RepID=UPI003CFBEC53